MNYQEMTNAQLVEVHNGLVQYDPDVNPLKNWKGKKDVLIDRIKGLEAKKPSEPKAKKEDGPTIREVALQLLGEVVYYEDKAKKSSPDNVVEADHPNARSVGIPYLEIIDRIKQQFPEAQTSVACLRWYAVKVRAEEFGYEGYRLAQRRPRAKPSN